MFYTWKNIKISYENNKFKISAPTWDKEFELPYWSHWISDIQKSFEDIFKTHAEKTVNPLTRIYINTIENRFTFKVKIEYYLELLTCEPMKLLGSTKKITKDENGENLCYL